MTEYTKDDLRIIHQSLTRLTQPGAPRPASAAELVAIGPLLSKTTDLINEWRPRLERGPVILTWRIATEHAPTVNEHNSWMQRNPWRAKKEKEVLRNQLDRFLAEIPALHLAGGQRVRWVRVTRFTPSKLDDTAPDQIGGKFPIDMMVKAGILVDDNQKWLVREGRVMKTKMGNTHVLVEVGEMVDNGGVTIPEPADGPRPDAERKKSKTRQHLETGETSVPVKPKRARARAPKPGMSIGEALFPASRKPFG